MLFTEFKYDGESENKFSMVTVDRDMYERQNM